MELEEDDGSLEIFLDTEEEEEGVVPEGFLEHNANLALYLPSDELDRISFEMQERFEDDKRSNQERFDYITRQLNTLGIQIEELSEPFPGASPVSHPLVLENAVKMQAKIMGEVFSGKSLVDVYITKDSEDVEQKANRIRKYMDFQFKNQLREYMTDTERMTLRYALTGDAYRKFTYDPDTDRPRSHYVTEDKFIINTAQSNLHDATFYTEIIHMPRHEYEFKLENGTFVEIREEESIVSDAKMTTVDDGISVQTNDSMGLIQGNSNSLYGDVELYEHTCYLKLSEPFNDDEERYLPYIVTREAQSQKVLSIRRNWREFDPKREKRVWHAHYKLIPGLGFHGYGFLHLLGNFQFALTQIVRSLIDAGQFANMQGGFRAKGVRVSRDFNAAIRFGEFREIDTGQRDIREVLMPLQFKEPSQVLYTLFMSLDERAQRFADSTDQIIQDSSNYGPVGTTVALLEASTKFINGIMKRFYNSLREELDILFDINADTLDEQMDITVRGETFTVTREDFDGKIEVIPAADPNMSSTAHRLSIANAKLQAALQSPDIHDLKQVYKMFYTTLGLEPEEIARFLPEPQQPEPLDPLGDILALTQGKQIKAFQGQDHDAHIQFKTNFMNDPQGANNQVLQNIIPLLNANIAEHQVLKYAERLAATVQKFDPALIAQAGAERAQAEASNFVLKANQLELQQNAELSGDPATMMAKASLMDAQARMMEVEHKKERDTAKLILEARKQQADEEKIKAEIGKDLHMQKTQIGADMVKTALTNLITPNE